MEFKDVIPNAEFVIELLNIILKNSLMTFNGEYFQQIFGVIRQQNRFIDNGFGITKANKFEFEYWVSEFNLLRDTITIDKFSYGNSVDFMDLHI